MRYTQPATNHHRRKVVKRFHRTYSYVVACAVLLISGGMTHSEVTTTATAPGVQPETVTVYPGITNISSVLVKNPMKGWVIYSNGRFPTNLSKTVLDTCSVMYLRPNWSEFEGEGEGKFNWEMIDTHIRDAKALGMKLSFRIMALNPDYEKEYNFPKWVVEGHEDEFNRTVIDFEGYKFVKWYPKDPSKSPRWKYACKHLIDALGKRYNNNPNIAFVEVGTIGDWGEQISNYAPTNQMLKQMPWREHLGWYRAAFPDTPLISVAAGQDHMEFAWQDENKFGRRSDGFCAAPVKEDTTDGAYQDGRLIGPSFHTRCPSFLEFPPGVSPPFAKRQFWWGTFWNGLMNFGKPTYLAYNMGNWMADYMYQQYPYRLIESANRVGYHLVLEQVSFPKDLSRTGQGTLTATFRNDGCRYPDYPIYVACALLDDQGKVRQQVWCEAINLKDQATPWVNYTQADTFSGQFALPIPKTYAATQTLRFAADNASGHLALGFFTDKKLPAPDVRLGNEGQHKTGWYPLDQYAQTPQTDAYPALHNRAFKKTVLVSATAEGNTGFITDGNATTKWRSPATAGQWMNIDLGSLTTFSNLALDWDETYPKAFSIEVSQDGAQWTPLCQTQNSTGGIQYLHVTPTQARYVRLTGNDAHGLALFDVEILGSTPAEQPHD